MKHPDLSSPLAPTRVRVMSDGASSPHEREPVEASASGKAIIVGEHAVVYGAHAIAMPVPSLTMTVRLTPTSRQTKQGMPVTRVLLGGRVVTPHLSGVVDDAFRTLGIEPYSLDIEGSSTVLIGAGLGSSASLCVVILKVLAAASKISLCPQTLARFANQLEARFHGNPSGLDTAVVAMGHAIKFRRGDQPTTVPVAAPAGYRAWRFALLDSGVRSSTLAMIQCAAPYFQGQEGQKRINAFDQAARDVGAALGSGDLLAVSSIMNQAAAWLAEARVVTDVLDDLGRLSREAGCLAAKPTGAGGGGCVLTLLDPEHADAQLARLRDSLGPNRVWPVDLSPPLRDTP